MVGHDEQIHGAKAIYRAHQIEFPHDREIAEMHHAELAESDVAGDRLSILRFVDLLGFERCAIRVRLSRSRQRGLEDLARGSHNAHIQARDRNLVAGFYDRVLGLAVKPRIDLLDKIIGCLSRLNVRTVVNELANRNAAREFFHASEVIAVPVSRDEVIDLFDTGIFDCGHDAVSVTRGSSAAVSRIDEQGLTRRRNEQRGVSTFHIHQVDVQRLRCPRLRHSKHRSSHNQQKHYCRPHTSSPFASVAAVYDRRYSLVTARANDSHELIRRNAASRHSG